MNYTFLSLQFGFFVKVFFISYAFIFDHNNCRVKIQFVTLFFYSLFSLTQSLNKKIVIDSFKAPISHRLIFLKALIHLIDYFLQRKIPCFASVVFVVAHLSLSQTESFCMRV